MKLFFRLGLSCVLFLNWSWAASLPQVSTNQKIADSGGIFRGTVLETAGYVDPKDGFIYTRTIFQVNEVFKGRLGTTIALVHRGGEVGGVGEADGEAPMCRIGEERLMFVSRRSDGRVEAHAGAVSALELSAKGKSTAAKTKTGVDLLNTLRAQSSDGPLAGDNFLDSVAPGAASMPAIQSGTPTKQGLSTATNLLVGTDNLPARFLAPDRGEPIVYYVDADYLPAGMTLTQALGAVQSALSAWTNVSSVRYSFGGLQSFGQAAANVNLNDGALRIQLHDHYNFIGGGAGEILGKGGHAWTSNNTASGWTTGGNAFGNDFHKTTRGYVVLQHTNSFMQNVTNFAEVMCHEVGHSLGFAHSSDTTPEPNPVLAQAIMYFTAHGSGRGAALNAFDTNVIRQVHSPTNTPPYCYDRVIDVVSAPTTLNIPGVNSAQVRGYDLQGGPLTLQSDDTSTINGTFSLSGSNAIYAPNGFFGDSPRIDPASGSYYDRITLRYSDGVNASPYVRVRVVSYASDSYSEGVSDTWRTTYFGDPDPSIGANHHATNDFDHDGFSNLQEFLLGSSPTNKLSNLTTTILSATNLQFEAKPYEVYELYGSTNLTTWTRQLNPVTPTNSPWHINGFTNGGPRQFFRVDKIP